MGIFYWKSIWPNNFTLLAIWFCSKKHLNHRWIISLVFQIISIGLSAVSTFAPIIEHLKYEHFVKNFQTDRKFLGLQSYIIRVLHVLLHIMFATFTVYLVTIQIVVHSVNFTPLFLDCQNLANLFYFFQIKSRRQKIPSL